MSFDNQVTFLSSEGEEILEQAREWNASKLCLFVVEFLCLYCTIRDSDRRK